MSKKLKVIFLGGIGEIGKNMTAFEYNDSLILIDAGLSFPTEETPGIDYVIPDYTYIKENQSKLKGIFLTHGHEDHIGCLPYLLKEIKAPVYGSKMTLAIVENKLSEKFPEGEKLPQMIEVNSGTVISAGAFNVEFIQMTHSIAGAFALSIDTPKGIIFHTGDFKLDYTPIDNRLCDLKRIAEIGSKGVLLMMSDSTNADREGYSMSERSVWAALDNIFFENTGKRIIVSCFASNIHRIQQILDVAKKYERKVAFSGRSMIKIAEISKEINELHYNQNATVEIDKTNQIPDGKLVILATGSQGEQSSALTRMAAGEYPKIKIGENDTVIVSASAIPGNERSINNVLNKLTKLGAAVIYNALADVHVSGHAMKEELKTMFALVKPKYFIPVHGEYRHLKAHSDIAVSMGIYKANIFIPELGSMVEIDKSKVSEICKVKAGVQYVDGETINGVDADILRDRRHLSEDGMVIAMFTTEEGQLLPPALLSRGIELSESVQKGVQTAVMEKINSLDYHTLPLADLKVIARKAIAKSVSMLTKKQPMVIPLFFNF